MKKSSPSAAVARRRRTAFCLAALLGSSAWLSVASSTRADTYTWTGGGADGNWSTAANWQNGVPVTTSQDTALAFGGTSRLASNQNLGTAFALNSLVFNSGAGAFTIGGGRLDFFTNSANTLPTLTQNSAALETINNDFRLNATLTVNGTGNLLLGGVLDGVASAPLTMAGTGTLTLTGNNTYNGGTIFQAGTVNVGSANALGNSSGTLSFTGGTLQYSAANQTDYSGRLSTAANQAYRIDTNNQSVTFATGLTSSGGSLTKLGAGTLTLTGSNTYTGLTNVNAGTLTVGSGGSLGATSVNVGAGAAFNVTGTGTGTGTTSYLTLDGTADNPAMATLSSTGTFSRGAVSVAYNGTATFNQSGGTFTTNGNPFYLGRNVGSRGTYTLSDTGSLSTGNAYIGVDGRGTFNQSGGTFTTNGNTLYLGFTADGMITYNGPDYGAYALSGTGSLSTGNAYVGYGGKGTFNQSGGTFTTNGNTLYLGFIYGSGGSGTYTLSGTGSLSTGDAIVGYGNSGTFDQSGGTFTTNGKNLYVGYNKSSNGTYALSGTGSLSTGNAYVGYNDSSTGTFTQNGGSFTTNGNTLYVGGAGSGTYALNGGMLQTGTIALGSAGILAVGGSGALGSGTISFRGGTLLATSNVQVTNKFTNVPGASVVMAAASGTTLTYHGSGVLGAPVGSQHSTVQFGVGGRTGTVNFTLDGLKVLNQAAGTNVQVTLQNGTLQTGVGAEQPYALALSFADVTLAAGTTFDLANTAPQVLNLYGTGTVTTSVAGGNNLLRVSGGEFDGSLTGGLSLAVTAPSSFGTTSGTLILGEANTFTGTATVSAGELQLSNGLALQNATAVLNTNGGLIFTDGIGTFALGGLSGDGDQKLVDAAGLAVTLQVGGGNADSTYAGGLSQTGMLVKTGTGTLTLTGDNTYTGGTIVSAGTLAAANPAALPGKVVVNPGATLAVNFGGTGDWPASEIDSLRVSATFKTGSILGIDTTNATGAATYPSSVGGRLGLTKLGGGTLTLTGANTYTGPTTISAGTLQAGVNSVAGTSSAFGLNSAVTLANVSGATLDLNDFSVQIGSLTGGGTTGGNVTLGSGTLIVGADNTSPAAFAGGISGTGGLRKVGTGTQTLSGSNPYTGPTSVTAGTLLVNGTNSGTGTITVTNSGSVLGGIGMVAGTVNVTGGGAINPGNNVGAAGASSTVGTLSVGALTLNNASSAVFDVNSATLYDEVMASGGVNLGGATLTLNVNPNATFANGQVLDLVHTSGSLSGVFTGITNGGVYSFGGDPFRAVYTATDFELVAVPEPTTWLGGALMLGAAGVVLRRRLRITSI